MRNFIYLLPIFLVFVFSSCSEDEKRADDVQRANDVQTDEMAVAEDYDYEESVESEADYSPEPNGMVVSAFDLSVMDFKASSVASTKSVTKQKKITQQKIIWKGKIKYQVEDIDKSTKQISDLVAKFNGNISSLNLVKSYSEVSNTIVVRVNSKSFHKLINSLKSKAKDIDQVEISSSDVTEQFVDIESRLKTKKEARQRYIEILRNKTGSIRDIIEAENAIRRITEEIEAKEGKLRYLQNKVDYSTLYIEIYQTIESVSASNPHRKSYIQDIVSAFGNGWKMIKHIVLFFINIWPILLIIVFGLILRRRYIKVKKN